MTARSSKPRRRFKTNLRLLTRRPRLLLCKYRWPLVVLLVGSVLDAATTYVNVAAYGIEAELHPANRICWMILGVSPFSVGFAKLVQMGFVVFVACCWRTWCGWLILLAGVLYTLASISNHFLLL